MSNDELHLIVRKATRARLLHYLNQGIVGAPEGKLFEAIVLRAFELEDAQVTWPFRVHIGDDLAEEIDGVVYVDGLACLIESKDQQSPLNVVPLAKMRNQLLRRPGMTIGIVFSRNGFTEAAQTLVTFMMPQTILLWDGPDLVFAIEKRMMRKGLQKKLRRAIEQAIPNFRLRPENY